VHDVKADQSTVRMSERFRHGGKYREAERLPEAYGGLIGLHDCVELHRRKPILRCDLEHAVGQGTSHTSTGCGRRHHEACVGDVATGSGLIRMDFSGSYDRTFIDGDEHSTAGFAHPPSSRRVFTSIGRPAVGVACGEDLLHESPDDGPIRIDDITDLHSGILTVTPGRAPSTLERVPLMDMTTCPKPAPLAA
jgi:hypothetical protein